MTARDSRPHSEHDAARDQAAGDTSACVHELLALLGETNVTTEAEELTRLAANSLGVGRTLVAAVRPGGVQDVQAVVAVANRHRVPLYPVSRGKNLGYGDRAPVRDGQILVDLSRLDRIRSFDELAGKVVVEPGVTQAQLHRFLAEQTNDFWMDVTGSGVDASLVGNTLEGGFGHTPVGNRRMLATGVEVVLGSGELLEAGTFPGLGPDLNRIFVQSNFGIVTAMELALFPAPEAFRSFIIRSPRDEDLEPLVDRIAALRRDGTLTSLVHLANPTRSLVSAAGLPEIFRGRPFTDDEAIEWLGGPFLPAGFWMASGALYGSRRLVAARRADLRRAMRGVGRVLFVGDRTIGTARRIAGAPGLRRLHPARRLLATLDSLEYVHGLARGVPSDQGIDGELRRAGDFRRLGLFWCSPALPAEGAAARAVADLGARSFQAHGFAMPLTITFVQPDRAIATMSCCFDGARPDVLARAHRLFEELHRGIEALGLEMYREGILGMNSISYRGTGKAATLAKIKRALDPSGIIAPGRYAID